LAVLIILLPLLILLTTLLILLLPLLFLLLTLLVLLAALIILLALLVLLTTLLILLLPLLFLLLTLLVLLVALIILLALLVLLTTLLILLLPLLFLLLTLLVLLVALLILLALLVLLTTLLILLLPLLFLLLTLLILLPLRILQVAHIVLPTRRFLRLARCDAIIAKDWSTPTLRPECRLTHDRICKHTRRFLMQDGGRTATAFPHRRQGKPCMHRQTTKICIMEIRVRPRPDWHSALEIMLGHHCDGVRHPLVHIHVARAIERDIHVDAFNIPLILGVGWPISFSRPQREPCHTGGSARH
jgi:hypothetical protein